MHTINDLIVLMSRLRDPADGCPWDLKQDFASIVPHTLEEVYEVVDTIERQDWTHLREELGDLLFQVVFYARLAEEQGDFTFADVVHDITEKLLRRHPHVFPDGTLSSRRGAEMFSEAQINANWEAIKQAEKTSAATAEQPTSILADVPNAMPAIARAEKLQKKAARVGFDWPESAPVWDVVHGELAELQAAAASGDAEHTEEELGDVLFSVVNLARHLKVNPETALRRANDKFIRRFGHIEQSLAAEGLAMNEQSLDSLDALWRAAKQAERGE
ncbi:nucleoside triphosphate pyrophosphohydrolase [Salinispirillum marinum]|uniref:Nucleoside triphosphate pyrophosphohydrolase n=2 Tax=Saccharospirillaceae TaxID=255527 RepID=A0ABV8BJZ5_9GAMM